MTNLASSPEQVESSASHDRSRDCRPTLVVEEKNRYLGTDKIRTINQTGVIPSGIIRSTAASGVGPSSTVSRTALATRRPPGAGWIGFAQRQAGCPPGLAHVSRQPSRLQIDQWSALVR